MKHIIRLGMLSMAMVLSIVGNSIPVAAVGEETPHILITEMSPASASSASEEYIELANPGLTDVDIAGWQLQYRSYSHAHADTGSWTTRAILGCNSSKASDCTLSVSTMLAAGDTVRLSSFETGDGVLPLAPGMSASGGEVRLVQPKSSSTAEAVHDMVGYGNAKDFEGTAPAPMPPVGRSLMRARDDKGDFVDTDHSDTDFVLSPDETAPVPPSAPPTTGMGGNTEQPASGTPQVYPDAEITEVMPDPASPQSDSSDEFIEIYNPYGEVLDLTGYVLKTGTNWTHKYTIGQVNVDPYGYVALMSAQTHLSLSNSGSGVQLYDPSGKLLFEVPSYGAAKSGNSWVRNSAGQWVWTAAPTPGEANTIAEPVASKPTSTSAPSTAKKSSSNAKGATTNSAKKASTPKASGAVKGISTTTAQPAAAPPANNQAGLWTLAGVGVLCVGYALFEYRQDIAGFFRRRWQALSGIGRNK